MTIHINGACFLRGRPTGALLFVLLICAAVSGCTSMNRYPVAIEKVDRPNYGSVPQAPRPPYGPTPSRYGNEGYPERSWQSDGRYYQYDQGQGPVGGRDERMDPWRQQAAGQLDPRGYAAAVGPHQGNPPVGQPGQQFYRQGYQQRQVSWPPNYESPRGAYGRGPVVSHVSVSEIGRRRTHLSLTEPTGEPSLAPSSYHSQRIVGPQFVAAENSGAVQPRPEPAVNLDPSLETPENAMQPQSTQTPEQPGESGYDRKQLITAMEQLISEKPGDTRAQLALRCLLAAYGQEKEALAELSAVPADQQQRSQLLAEAVLLVARSEADTDQADADRAARILKALAQLQSQIAPHADPVISKVVLCSRVENFGRYDICPESQLGSGQPQRVLVYCELENLQRRKNAEGKYLTDLKAKITLCDANLNVIEKLDELVTDTSYNPRRDFFLRGALDLPRLAPGKYIIVVNVEDRVAEKIARDVRHEFEVAKSESVPR